MFLILFWLFIGCLLGHIISQWLYQNFQFINRTVLFRVDKNLNLIWTPLKLKCCSCFQQLKKQYYFQFNNHNHQSVLKYPHQSNHIKPDFDNFVNSFAFRMISFKDTLREIDKITDKNKNIS